MWPFLTAIFTTTGKDRTSLAGRYISYKFILLLAFVFVLSYSLISPLILQVIAPGYSAVKKYTAITQCATYKDGLTDSQRMDQYREAAQYTDKEIYPDFEFKTKYYTSTHPPSCTPSSPGGTLYCESDSKIYISPKNGTEDQKYICPLVSDLGYPGLDSPKALSVVVSEDEQRMFVTISTVLIFILAHYIFTSTRIRNVQPIA